MAVMNFLINTVDFPVALPEESKTWINEATSEVIWSRGTRFPVHRLACSKCSLVQKAGGWCTASVSYIHKHAEWYPPHIYIPHLHPISHNP